MHECTLYGNSAVNFGGTMITDQSTVSIIRCLFTRSEVINYGMIGIYRSAATIQHSNFTNSHAVHAGGVFVVWLCTITVVRSMFEDNTVDYDGGVTEISRTTIYGALLRNNVASNGGAIKFDDNSVAVYWKISTSLITQQHIMEELYISKTVTFQYRQ